jgi:hypothetical protein
VLHRFSCCWIFIFDSVVHDGYDLCTCKFSDMFLINDLRHCYVARVLDTSLFHFLFICFASKESSGQLVLPFVSVITNVI